MTDGWARTLGRHNPYAGAHEQELHEALNANPFSITDAEDAWVAGAGDLADLKRNLTTQKNLIRETYKGAGEEAALVYERMETMVGKREQEMLDVAAGLKMSHDAVTAARKAYYDLPPVRPPSDGTMPAALPMGATKKEHKKHAETVATRKQEIATADANHEADKRAAEAKAVEALGILDTSLNASADKMRDVAGMPKPDNSPGSGSGVPVNHALSGASGPPSQAISSPGTSANPTPTTQAPPTTHPVNPHPVDTGNLPPSTTPPPSTGVLAGPTETVQQPTVPSALGNPSPSSSTSASPAISTAAGLGVAAAPASLAASALRRTATPLPGTSAAARGATLGRSSSATPARGALGRNAMMPGQTAARTTSGGRTAGATGRGGRMVPGQGAAGARGKAGSRGAMVPGTGAGRGKGDKRDENQVDLLWDDGNDWLGEDETAPQTLS